MASPLEQFAAMAAFAFFAAWCLAFAWHIRLTNAEIAAAKRQRALAAMAQPKSRKHTRAYIGWGEYRLTYYGENGRKVTSRTVSSFDDFVRLRRQAAAKGYRPI